MASPFTESTLEAVTETEFLDEMEYAVPWGRLAVLVAPLLPAAPGGTPAVSEAETLMRLFMLQRWLSLTPAPLLREVQRVPRYRTFVLGLDTRALLPDAAALSRFGEAVWGHARTRGVIETIDRIVEEDRFVN